MPAPPALSLPRLLLPCFLLLPLAPDLRAQAVVVQACLEPARTALVCCRAAGVLAEVRVREGDTVAAGDTLACLDRALPQLRLEAAAADHDAARHRAEAARALHARGQLAPCDLEPLQALLRAALLRYAEAQAAVEATVLRARFAGRVAEVRVQPGDLLASGQACVRLVDAADLQARLYLTPEQLGVVHPGQRATAVPWAPPGPPGAPTAPAIAPPLHGTLTFLAAQLDAERGTAMALVRFPGAGQRLRSGTLVILTLPGD